MKAKSFVIVHTALATTTVQVGAQDTHTMPKAGVKYSPFNQGAPGRLVSSYRAPKPIGVREFNLGFRCVVTVGASSP